MNRTYTYAELKERIQKDYETFNFIIESKHIFNQEFIGFRKFFKNLLKKQSKKKNEWFRKDQPVSETNKKFDILYPYFESVITAYRIYLNKETVADLSMTQLYKDFPNLKADYDLLLSLKEKVRSGKRPKDLEKDYEAERLRKAEEEDKATCGICHEYWEQVDMEGEGQKFGLSKNVIADHGFTIRFGGRNGICFGARFHAWEKSPKVKIEYVKQVLKPLLNSVLKEQPTQVTVDAYKNRIKDYFVAKKEYNNLPNELIIEYKNKEREMGDSFDPTTTWNPKSYSENVKKVHAIYKRYTRPAIAFSGQRVATPITLNAEEVTLEYLTKLWFDYKTRLENEIATFETAIKNWKLQPTPRERLGK